MATIVCYLEDGTVVTHPLDKEITTIGRSPDSLISLDCPSVSSHHAMIKLRPDGIYVQDLGSSNGTKVNGAPVEEAVLKEGDQVIFGGIQCLFYEGDAPDVPEPISSSPSTPSSVRPPDLEPEPVASNPLVAPKPKVPLNKARTPAGKSRTPAGTQRPHPAKSYAEEEGGCFTGFMVTALFLAAFLTGLAVRHHQETDQNLFSDVIEKFTGALPEVRIETQR